MSGWKYPPEPIPTTTPAWLWNSCTTSLTNDTQFIELFEIQQYVGPLERLYLYAGASDGNYRILTRPPIQYVIATAENKTKIQEFIHLAHIEILPRVQGLSNEMFHSILPSLLEKLAHQTTLSLLRDWNLVDDNGIREVDLATVIEGIRNDSLMMSITFEYENPPPPELLCATCKLPAVDPHVSPYFLGKVFCKSCTTFEGGSFFLKANNLASMLDDLEVYCPFTSFGCGVVLPRGQLGTHLQDCPHVRIVCVNKQYGCTFGARSKIEAIQHMQSCEFASAMCNEISEHRRATSSSSLPLPPHFLPNLRDVVNMAGQSTSSGILDSDATSVKRKCTFCAVEEGSENNNFNKLNNTQNNNNNNNNVDSVNNNNNNNNTNNENNNTDDSNTTTPNEQGECAFHSGTWCGYTYKQVQEWRLMVWKQRFNAGVKCIVHFPIEVAKSTTALGVGILSFSAIVAGAFVAASSVFLPEMLIAGGFLLVAPTPVTSFVAGTIFSPTLFYNVLYKIPYNLIWGKSPPQIQQPEAWTCCNRLGSSADPCETRGIHNFVL